MQKYIVFFLGPGSGWLRGSARRAPLVLALSCAAWVGIGCRSTDEPRRSLFASVQVRDSTPGQISYATVQVFREHRYFVAQGGLTNLVFERKAGEMGNLAYGNWMGDTVVWERVKAEITPLTESLFLLQCEAWMVRDKGGSTEEEIRLAKYRHKPYQKLLEEVAQRLNPEPEKPR